jgi:hypothetical protein
MRVLPDVVGRRSARRIAAVGLALAAAAALAGCAKFDAALSQRLVLVSFQDGTTVAQKLAVRSACAKVANVVPQPLPSDIGKHPYEIEQVTFEIDKASDTNVAQLEQCLSTFHSVTGVTLRDPSDDGD